ncbi:CvpA family protein [candidate division KSB1 bacterium]
MNYIDIIIISIMLFFIIKGFIKGFTREIMGILSFIIAFYAALSQMKMAANILNGYFHNYSISLIVGYIAVFLFVFIIIHMIAKALTKLLHATSLGWLNRLGGGVFGFLFGGMLIALLVALLSLTPLTAKIPPGKSNSKLYPYFERVAPRVFDVYLKLIPNSQSLLNDVTGKVISEKLMKSGMSVDNIDNILQNEKIGNILQGKNLQDILQNKDILEKLDISKLLDNFKGADLKLLGNAAGKDSAGNGVYKELFDQLNIGKGEQQTIEEMIKDRRKK